MPTPSKFTAERRKLLLEGAELGLSRTSNAIHAGMDDATLRRWLEKGRTAPEGSAYKAFRQDFLAAEIAPRKRALGIVQRAWPDKPDLAWKYLERREPGYAPPMQQTPAAQAAPVVVALSFSGRAPLQLASADVIEGEIVEQDDQPNPDQVPAG